MTPLLRSLSRSALFIAAVALSACQGAETEEALSDTGSVSQALCTATQNCPSGAQISCNGTGTVCVADQDGSGLYVQCDGGARIYCPPACTCSPTTKTAPGAAWGATCGEAYFNARAYAEEDSDCPGRTCYKSFTLLGCTPVSSNKTDGFNASVRLTYQCKEPVGCYP